MAVAMIKTKAEQFLASELQSKVRALSGSGAVRAEAMERFSRAGFPHRQIEAWKYSDLKNILKEAGSVAVQPVSTNVSKSDVDRALGELAAFDAQRIVFIDGHLDRALSNISGSFSVAGISTYLDAPVRGASALPSDETIVDLNRALVTDGVHLEVGAGEKIATPLMIVNLASGTAGNFISLRNRLLFGANASATVIEVHGALSVGATGQQNIVTDVVVGDGAAIQHIQIGLEGAARTSLVTSGAVLGRDSVYRLFKLSADSAFARRQTFLRFDGEGSKLDVSGLILGRGTEHCDVTLVIDHAVPGCESREHFKAVLNDNARAVFQAKVIVRQDAQKTDGKQMANALMLSPTAEFDSKPELEIYADDVVCGHGATVAEIDDDLLFYVRSRGIPLAEARAMLIESFVAEVLAKIDVDPVREALTSITGDWLTACLNGDRS